MAISPQAARLEELLKSAPKQIDLPLAQKREAGEHAEDLSSEPEGVAYEDAPEVGGLWAKPAGARDDAVDHVPVRRRLYDLLAALASQVRRPPGPSGRHARPGPGLRARARASVPRRDRERARRVSLSARRVASIPAVSSSAGDSSGGGLAAVATLLALKRAGLPLPAGAVPISPWADLACTGQTLETLSAVDLTVTKDGLQRMAVDYLGGADPRDPLASPIYGDFSGLAPLLVIVGGHEGLLDDAVNLARQAAIGGVDVSLRIWAGMQHVFPIYAGFLPEADAAIALIGSWIRARLEPG